MRRFCIDYDGPETTYEGKMMDGFRLDDVLPHKSGCGLRKNSGETSKGKDNMIEMKYVVVNSKEKGEQLFVFPTNVIHSEFAEVLSYMKEGDRHNWKRIFRQPISAGFTDGSTCYGRSESLNLSSRKNLDTALLKAGGFSKSCE